ncbi:MAG: carboxypeptidase-like regulatory domain-containing protein, partial [Mucilaginibacter sp.]
MKKLLLVSLCFLMLCVTQVFAQNRTITGTVTSKEDGLPIPGATVKVKGTASGTQTNSAGKYTLSVPSGATLVFSFIGTAPQSIPIESKTTIDVALVAAANALNEVVVTSLGLSSQKRTLGYSQTTVKGETMSKSSPISLLTGVQGKVAGVNISEVGSTPGGTTKVIIRGYS